MPITWKNVSAPESYGANQLMNQGANRIDQSFNQLGQFANQERDMAVQRTDNRQSEAANIFQREIENASVDDLAMLGQQFDQDPQSFINEFGNEGAEALYQSIQNEPQKREEKEILQAQHKEELSRTRSKPIVDKASVDLNTLLVNPNDIKAKENLDKYYTELIDGGYSTQAAELAQARISNMEAGELKVFQDNTEKLTLRRQELEQGMISGDLDYNDYMAQYDKLKKEFGPLVMGSSTTYAEWDNAARQLAVQAGQVTPEQGVILEGVAGEITKAIEYGEAELDSQEQIINQRAAANYFSSVSDPTTANGANVAREDFNSDLVAAGISDSNRTILSNYLQTELEREAESLGLGQVPTAIWANVRSRVNPTGDGWFGAGVKRNKASILAAVKASVNEFKQHLQIEDEKEELKSQYRKVRHNWGKEAQAINNELNKRFKDSPTSGISPEELREVYAKYPTLGALLDPSLVPQRTVPEPESTQSDEDLLNTPVAEPIVENTTPSNAPQGPTGFGLPQAGETPFGYVGRQSNALDSAVWSGAKTLWNTGPQQIINIPREVYDWGTSPIGGTPQQPDQIQQALQEASAGMPPDFVQWLAESGMEEILLTGSREEIEELFRRYSSGPR